MNPGRSQTAVNLQALEIRTPKQSAADRASIHGIYSYYAAFSTSFATTVIDSARLHRSAIIFDPWSGSGTTSFAAFQLGFMSVGFDLNPVMNLVAKSRFLSPAEALTLHDTLDQIISVSKKLCATVDTRDPLLNWFTQETVSFIRSLEQAVFTVSVGKDEGFSKQVFDADCVSSLEATLFVSLFALCRHLTNKFRSSNPTWLRRIRSVDERLAVPFWAIESLFRDKILCVVASVRNAVNVKIDTLKSVSIRVADTTDAVCDAVDFIVSSPPYCTRLDYAAATRVELALLYRYFDINSDWLSRKLMGSTKVPKHNLQVQPGWGERCSSFLYLLGQHSSKASRSYYLPTHLDYFDKLYRSLQQITRSLRPGGGAVLVVQDSHYKELHNDVPGILVEMAGAMGLQLKRRQDFVARNCLSQINSRTRQYRIPGSTEAVLCLKKI